MSAPARSSSKQTIRGIGWQILGLCCLVLAPLTFSFAAPKQADATKAAHAASVRFRHHSFGIGIFGIMGFPHPPARPTIYAAPPAMVYIEKDAPQDSPSDYVWYYCRSRQTYYPYIIDCPEAWEEVNPSANSETGTILPSVK